MASFAVDAGGGVDVGLLVLAASIVLGAAAPLGAVVTSLWPSRATRWASRACLAMVAVSGVLFVVLVRDARRRPPGLAPGQEWGDDSGVYLVAGLIVVLFGVVNLAGWALARRRAPTRASDRGHEPPPPPPSPHDRLPW